MNRRLHHQTGAFILATVVFLMVAGSVMLYAMSNLSMVSSATTSVAHNGNMALMAAQSGLKYCVALGSSCPDIKTVVDIDGISCKIEIDDGNCAAGICTVTSTACCPNSSDSLRAAKKLEIKVQNINGYYQMIPASRRVVAAVTCP
jgi:hypothetical protein